MDLPFSFTPILIFVAAIAAINPPFKPMVKEGIIKSTHRIYFNYNIISVAF